MTDLSLLEEFIVESNEHLEEMEASLLRLEQVIDDKSIYDDIFRNIHSIKGGAQYLELEKVSLLAHSMENLLDPLRAGKKQATTKAIDVLIDGRDLLAKLLKELEEEQTEKSGIIALIGRLNQLAEKDDISYNAAEMDIRRIIRFNIYGCS